MDLRKRQPLQAVNSHPDDHRLQFIEEFGEMSFNMSGRLGKREKQLSKDTAFALFRTCNDIVELTKNLLLQEDYEYVCFGEFSTDVLEKAFGKLRQGSGGSYFITAQQVTEKLRIKQAKLQISLHCDLQISAETVKHQCSNCEYVLDAYASTVFDSLPDLENSVSEEMKVNLAYISGYVTRKLNEEGKDYDDTYCYYEKYGRYLASLDRSGLNVPQDSTCQWAIFCCIIFDVIKTSLYRRSLTSVFQQVSDAYNLHRVNSH